MPTQALEPIIEGKRFILRRVTAEDAPLIFSWLQDISFAYYMPSFSRLCPSVPDLIRRIITLEALNPPLEIEGLVVHRPTDVPIGLVKLTSIDRINRKAEFSIGFMRGHGTRCLVEALCETIEQAFVSMYMHKLIFYVSADNANMMRAVLRYGLRHEGIFKEELMTGSGDWTDLHRFALLDREWKESPLRRRLARILEK